MNVSTFVLPVAPASATSQGHMTRRRKKSYVGCKNDILKKSATKGCDTKQLAEFVPQQQHLLLKAKKIALGCEGGQGASKTKKATMNAFQSSEHPSSMACDAAIGPLKPCCAADRPYRERGISPNLLGGKSRGKKGKCAYRHAQDLGLCVTRHFDGCSLTENKTKD